uniref:C-type lectin domain-containing protein n=1 Tax=Monopterus albus TaxID=43700 RepID=A0A3Q3KH32_MONAL
TLRHSWPHPGTVACNDQPSFCPSHWVPYGGNCYYLVRDKKMWRDALAACHREGGDLASIHNIEEQSFIISQTGYCKCHNEPVWIGLNSNTGGRFKWVDNWLLSYTKWGRDEPKNNYGCVYIDVDRTWKTAPCTNNYYSLCKRSPGETVPLLVLQTS